MKEHLDYEKLMLLQLHMLAANEEPWCSSQAQWNAVVESFCIHAACLLDYATFNGSWIVHPDRILFLRKKINEQILTLTFNRTSNDEDKVTGEAPRRELFDYLSTIYNLLEPHKED